MALSKPMGRCEAQPEETGAEAAGLSEYEVAQPGRPQEAAEGEAVYATTGKAEVLEEAWTGPGEEEPRYAPD